MAIEKILDQSGSNSGSLPFLEEWIEANPKNKETAFLISEVKLGQKGNGYSLITDDFKAWLWKNSKLCKQFIAGLEYYSSTPDVGYACFVVLNKPGKPEFTVGVDKDIAMTWRKTKNGFALLGVDPDSDITEMDGNPFI